LDAALPVGSAASNPPKKPIAVILSASEGSASYPNFQHVIGTSDEGARRDLPAFPANYISKKK